MDPRLIKIVQQVKNRDLRSKIQRMLEDPSVEVNGNTYRGIPLEDSPASIRHHHNYPGGFVEHTLAMTDLSLALCDIVENVYQCAVDRDLVLCGALLHDIFKPVTYAEDNGRYKRSPIAERIDHLSLATAELIRRRFPLEAVHVIVASHGSEHGPIGPQTIEALICHLADWTDAKLNGDVLNGARWIVREVIGEDLPHLTGELAFKIIRSKTDSGLGKVRELLEQRNLIPTKNNS